MGRAFCQWWCIDRPQTEQGRKRCAEDNYVHGWETRAKRRIRATKFREMKSVLSLDDVKK